MKDDEMDWARNITESDENTYKSRVREVKWSYYSEDPGVVGRVLKRISNGVCDSGLNSSGSGEESVAGSSGHGNEPSCSWISTVNILGYTYSNLAVNNR
jgi:hypothetical protein